MHTRNRRRHVRHDGPKPPSYRYPGKALGGVLAAERALPGTTAHTKAEAATAGHSNPHVSAVLAKIMPPDEATVAELKTVARTLGLKGYTTLKKSDLVKLVNKELLSVR